MHAYIFNIQRFSIHDGPGIRTTVFFQGCPLQCVWCHNAEGIPHYLETSVGKKIFSGVQKYSLDELMTELLKDKVFFEESGGGVTFSGGEPLMQSDFLIAILKRLREANIHTAVDTSGYAPDTVFNQVCGLADLILMDIKIVDKEKHKTYTDTENTLIHNNLGHLLKNDIPFRVRIPLVNELTADDENLLKIADLLKSKIDLNIDLLSYHDLGQGKQDQLGFKTIGTTLTAPGKERMQEIQKMFESFGFKVNIGG
jgi:pyruvate formate lyase activating enzyme